MVSTTQSPVKCHIEESQLSQEDNHSFAWLVEGALAGISAFDFIEVYRTNEKRQAAKNKLGTLATLSKTSNYQAIMPSRAVPSPFRQRVSLGPEDNPG